MISWRPVEPLGADTLKLAIVGAGISGLATAHALLVRRPDLEISIYEADRRTGGKVWTERTPEGFLCEGGVNGFLDNKPKTLALARELDLSPLASYAASRKRYILSRGLLHLLPETPLAFLAFKAMSLWGRLRVMYEVFAPTTDSDDESLAEFARRRLGKEAFEVLIDPMASGVFAGDATALSLKSCFPRIHAVEQEYGSLIRGLIRLQIKARREGKAERPGPGPSGTLTSFGNGMSTLTAALTDLLGDRIHTGVPIVGLSRSAACYTLHTATGGEHEAEAVVLAAPAYVQADILRSFAPDIASQLDAIEYPAVSVCCFGYRKQQLRRHLEGFGFLIPTRERRRILGTVVDSNVFPGRAPEGSVLLRTLIGGARTPELARLPDKQLIDVVCAELKDIMGIDAMPEFIRLYRHDRAIPQYQVGHAARLEVIEHALRPFPGLILSGNAYRGVSLNDCIANADQTAEMLLKRRYSGSE